MKSFARRSEAGFSFVELLITIVIAGIAFAALVPLFVSAQSKSAADNVRVAVTQVAQDKIEKMRQLPYGDITAANLQSSTFASGQFGTTHLLDNGTGTRPITLSYAVTSYPAGSAGLTSQYKVVVVTATWTAPPAPVRPVTLSTIIYRQYAGPPIIDFSTSPIMDDTGVLGDTSLTVVTLTATIDTTAGVVPSQAIFKISSYGGAEIASQTVKVTDTNAAGTYYYDGTGVFTWKWDASTAANGLYDFQVTAYSAADGSAGNTPHLYPRIQHDIPPDPPTNVTAVAGDATVTLTWNASLEPDVASYEVYRATSAAGPWTTPIATVPESSQTYVDDTAANGTTYYYAVRTVTTESKYSEFAISPSATPQASADTTAPTAPNGLTATKVAGAPTINLTWSAATDPGSPSTGVAAYEIWRSDDGVTWGSAPLYTWTNLASLAYPDASAGYDATWYYELRAVDGVGNRGPLSSVVSAHTDPLPHHALTIRNIINGNNKTRYVWVQNAGTGQYYDQSGNDYSSPPAAVSVPSKNGTKTFSNLPDGPYHVWVSTTSSFSGAAIQSPDPNLAGADGSKDIS
jgi:type II secretory pathway pseudopilin PulG